MATRKTTSKFAAILRPISQHELDSQRKYFADLDRKELEDLLIRAAHKIENLGGRLNELEAQCRMSLVRRRRSSDARWDKDDRTKIKALARKAFEADWATKIHERGARANFISAMDLAHAASIQDAKTFGTWWDKWKKELNISAPTPLDVESTEEWSQWMEAYTKLEPILKLLGHVPKLQSR